MFARLENGVLIRAPKMLPVGEYNVYNPTDEMLLNAGYLPVELTPAPETDEEHYAMSYYEAENGKIVQKWEIVEMEET